MTKRRAPLSFEAALTTVAGSLGWEAVAKVCHVAERTARNWSDPDTSACVTLDHALALDAAFIAAGGDHAPFLMVYSARIDAAAATGSSRSLEIVAAAGLAAKEGGEAIAATLAASRPDASAADLAIAERELEESIAAQSKALATIKNARGTVNVEGGNHA